MTPEQGYGEKNRKIKFQAGPGGKECDCSEGFCTKASCRDPCPGNRFEHIYLFYLIRSRNISFRLF